MILLKDEEIKLIFGGKDTKETNPAPLYIGISQASFVRTGSYLAACSFNAINFGGGIQIAEGIKRCLITSSVLIITSTALEELYRYFSSQQKQD